MSAQSEARPVGTENPRFAEGMLHLQAGEWQAAIDCFEELAHERPYDRSVQRALEEARFKASLDATSVVRAKHWDIRWRPSAVRGLILVATLVLASFPTFCDWSILFFYTP